MANKFSVTDKKYNQLLLKMEELGIRESDIEETFIRASGKGGQKVNKTASCVRLFYKPMALELKTQEARSQALNRFFARRLLCERVEEQTSGSSKRIRAEQKARKQKSRRRRRSASKPQQTTD